MLETRRLVLRPWREDDLVPFAALNADTDVMRYFEGPRTFAETEASLLRFNTHIEEHGFGFWAVEVKQDRSFAGMIGLEHVNADLPFAPAIEIGWRLRKDMWGQGIAPEGATRTLKFAFDDLKATEIVSFTAKRNHPSRRVMDKIGMRYGVDEDFDHPGVTKGHALVRHCLYRIKACDFKLS